MTTQEVGDRLLRIFEKPTQWRPLAHAVVHVLLENHQLEHISGYPAAKSEWTVIGTMRDDVWERTRTVWGRFTGRPVARFPFSVDYVAWIYSGLTQFAVADLQRWADKVAEV